MPKAPRTAWPSLGKVDSLSLDTETDGLDRHGPSRPVGVSIYHPAKGGHYLRWGHPSGNNCSQSQFADWARQELRGNELRLVNPSFDLHMLLKAGVDTEALGCKPTCVQYRAALLDDNRQHFDLNTLAWDFLKEKKDDTLDYSKIATYPGDQVAPYAQLDAELTYRLHDIMAPLLNKEDLQQVATLEDDLIYCTLSMELAGVRLDRPKLERWKTEIEQMLNMMILPVNVNSSKQLDKYLTSVNIPTLFYTAPSTKHPRGQPSFTEQALRTTFTQYPDDRIMRILNVRWLRGILEKYIVKYLEALDEHNILRYNLHQCRSDNFGTVSGRYSSSNVNIQQVAAEEKQEVITQRWIIRELFLPSRGRWLGADASQIEFRWFAHYSKSKALISAYQDNPDTDFHEVVSEMTGIIRKKAKNINFMSIYGGSAAKYAEMVLCSMEEANEFWNKYHKRFPEAKILLNRAMRIAKQRGYVSTILGRRARFPDRQRLHSALNRVIQGTAADVMKLKLRQLYKYQKELNFKLRFTVHDEVCGDFWGSPKQLKQIADILNEQSVPCLVPITWSVKVGANWRETSK